MYSLSLTFNLINEHVKMERTRHFHMFYEHEKDNQNGLELGFIFTQA